MESSDPEAVTNAPCCDLSAIAVADRPTHVALVRRLFAEGRLVIDAESAVEFELAIEWLADVAAFIENERRCCRHLAFSVDVPPGSNVVRLRVSGPGARAELRGLIE